MADRILVYGVTGAGKTTLAARISAANGIPWYSVDSVALDYPRWVSFGRLLRRTAVRIVDRRPICNGNHETLRGALARDSILRWHFRSFGRKRQRMRDWEERAVAEPSFARVVRLASPRATRRWLACGCPGGTS